MTSDGRPRSRLARLACALLGAAGALATVGCAPPRVEPLYGAPVVSIAIPESPTSAAGGASRAASMPPEQPL